MNYAEEKYTPCFQYPQTKHFYIALTVHALKKFIYDWIEEIYDCYDLHAKSFDQEFVLFCENVFLQSLLESNEELQE